MVQSVWAPGNWGAAPHVNPGWNPTWAGNGVRKNCSSQWLLISLHSKLRNTELYRLLHLFWNRLTQNIRLQPTRNIAKHLRICVSPSAHVNAAFEFNQKTWMLQNPAFSLRKEEEIWLSGFAFWQLNSAILNHKDTTLSCACKYAMNHNDLLGSRARSSLPEQMMLGRMGWKATLKTSVEIKLATDDTGEKDQIEKSHIGMVESKVNK